MLGFDLVRPLDESWRVTLDAVARARGWPASRDVAKLGARVAALSAAYNDPHRARASAIDAGAARLGFAFPRDVPKGAAAVRELLAVGALPRQGALRVLDLGAGLGAMTWGLHRARALAGGSGAIDVTWVDADGEALELGVAVARERAREAGHDDALRIAALRAPIEAVASASPAFAARGPFDVVLVGNVLSELDVGRDPAARAAAHAAWLHEVLRRHVTQHGSLVVVEPALRDRTRHLHRVRDAVVDLGATVFAPCLHARPCPALAREGDWCHEDLRVDLPPWLVPVSRAAGLRHEGLTFSYLVLRSDAATLGGAVQAPAGARRLRVVSGTMKSKGKLEAYVCGAFPSGPGPGPGPGRSGGDEVAARVRAMRLDRDANDANAEWDELERGDVAIVAPALELAGAQQVVRVDAAKAVTRAKGESL
jgi:SAM-dependent methyltransferase